MADAFLSSLIRQISSILEDQVRQEVKLVVGVDREIDRLYGSLQSIRALCEDAERRQIKDKVVELWLKKLTQTSYDIENVLDEWSTLILKFQIEQTPGNNKVHALHHFAFSFRSYFVKLASRRNIGYRIKDLNERLDKISQEKDRFNLKLIERSSSEPSVASGHFRIMTTSDVNVTNIYGRDDEKHMIIDKLLGGSSQGDSSLTVISIVGMGGIGKTTLAQLAFNDKKVKDHFEKRMWVCVSDPFDIIRVGKAILEALDCFSLDINELESILKRIRESIEGSKFLLVLDDVWEEDDQKLEPLRNTLEKGCNASRVLITTRKEKVSEMMRANSMLCLRELPEDKCWSLFQSTAFYMKTETEHEELKDIGRQLVEKCKGLPLAVKVVGGLLWSKGAEQWQEVLDSEIWKYEDAEKKLFPHLLLSYYDLPSTVRRCFVYGAVFPKDHRIRKTEIIRLWRSQGYLISMRQNTDLEIVGEEFFNCLASRSLLQDFEVADNEITSCKMHDIVHDFIEHLAGDEILNMIVKDDGSPIRPLCYDKILHLGLEASPPGAQGGIIPSSCLQAKKLLTLRISMFNHQVLPLVFKHFKRLRALALIEYPFEKIAREIKNLIHLRCLHVPTRCLDDDCLEALPEEICELCNLQYLIVDSIMLKKLPKGLGRLINLHTLIFNGRKIKGMPKGIERLTSLRTLSKFIVSNNKSNDFSRLKDLKGLNKLRGRLIIECLGNVKDPKEAREAELKNKRHLSHLTLHFGPYRGLKYLQSELANNVAEELEPAGNLEYLDFFFFHGTKFPSWIVSLSKLRTLKVQVARISTTLPAFGKLPLLESLYLWNLPGIERVDDAFLGIETHREISGAKLQQIAFPKLKELKFEFMINWQEWDGIMENEQEQVVNISIMPFLVSLTLWNCPKLESLPNYLKSIPLQKLEIKDCSGLKMPEYYCGGGEFS